MNLIDQIMSLAAEKVLVTETVSEETAAFRRTVCNECDRLDQVHDRCKVCTCYIEPKSHAKINHNPKKLRQEITHCPLGKWNDLETANEYRKIDGLPPLTV